jgi:hypothetical protein
MVIAVLFLVLLVAYKIAPPKLEVAEKDSAGGPDAKS